MDDTLTLIGDDPNQYRGEGNLCARLGMEFHRLGITDRTQRLQYISQRAGRQVGSMKDLTVREGEHLLSYLKGL